MDKKLLLDIFHIASPSTEEENMKIFLRNWLKEHEIEFEEDGYGNIYNISKKSVPLIAAHIDTVQDTVDAKLAKFIREINGVISGLGIIGADDKNGVFIILELLKEIPDRFNFAFFVEEEIGLNGSNYFVTNNGKYIEENILYSIVLDRRNAGNILCVNNDYGTFDFEMELEKIGKEFGYKADTGTLSDADNLSDYISATNLSVGYYNAHSKTEYTVLSEIENTINYVRKIITTLDEKFEKPEKVYSYYGGHKKNKKSKGYYYDRDFDDYVYFSDKCAICGKDKDNTIYLAQYDKSVCYECAEKIMDSFEFHNFYYEDNKTIYEDEPIVDDEKINKYVGEFL